MGRIVQIIFVLAIILVVLFLLKKGDNLPNIKISKDTIFVKDFKLKENVNNLKFYKIGAKEAVIYNNYSVIEMKGCNVVFTNDNNKLNVSSDSCKYIADDKFEMFDNLSGFFNEFSFSTKRKGHFIYKLDENTGKVDGGIIVKSSTSKLLAESVSFNKDLNIANFDGNIEVNYEY